MRALRSLTGALGAVAALCAITLLAMPSAAGARPLQTGFLDDNAFYNEEPQVSNVWFGRARAAGTSLVRLNAYWSTIAPRKRSAGFTAADPADPEYSWKRLDDSVRGAAANGLVPILTVLSAPSWAEGSDRDPSAIAGTWRPSPDDLAAFAQALARRYSGAFPDPENPAVPLPRIAYFQAWNEPNLHYYLTPQFENGNPVSPSHYRSLLNAFYAAIKSVQPSATVLSAGLAPIGRPDATVGPLRFMRLLTCMGGGAKPRPTCESTIDADIWSTHPYTTGGPEHEAAGRDDVSLGDLPEMATLLKAADRFGHIRGTHRMTPFWITEFSWDTKPPDPKGVPMAIAKRWVAEALYRMWSAGVSAVTWLTIRDGANPQNGSSWADTYQSGFYFFRSNPTANRPKPSLGAFRFPFVAFPQGNGIRIWGRTPTSLAGPVLIQIRARGSWRSAGSVPADRSGIFHTFLRPEQRPSAVRAWFGPEVSIPFSMTPVRDRYVRPFGG